MARRKIATESKDELPDLTDKQLKFCEGILAGLTQRAAYKQAYDCKSSSDAAIDVNASRLRHDAKIALWLDAARSDVLKTHECTFEGHMAELERLKGIAIRTGNVGAAVQAEQLRGKAAGHYVEKYADVTYDPVRILEQIAAINPGLAAQLAKAKSIPWQAGAETRH